MLVTDTYHQFRPRWTSTAASTLTTGSVARRRTTTGPSSPPQTRRFGNATSCTGRPLKARQYLANTSRETRGLVRPQGVPPGDRVPGGGQQGAVLPGSGQLRPARALGPASRSTPPSTIPKATTDRSRSLPSTVATTTLTERQLRRMRALYAGEVTMVDRWLGRFLDRMDELDLFENTHPPLRPRPRPRRARLHRQAPLRPVARAHGYRLHDPAPRRQGAGETSDHYASTHDVAPTISWASSA